MLAVDTAKRRRFLTSSRPSLSRRAATRMLVVGGPSGAVSESGRNRDLIDHVRDGLAGENVYWLSEEDPAGERQRAERRVVTAALEEVVGHLAVAGTQRILPLRTAVQQ